MERVSVNTVREQAVGGIVESMDFDNEGGITFTLVREAAPKILLTIPKEGPVIVDVCPQELGETLRKVESEMDNTVELVDVGEGWMIDQVSSNNERAAHYGSGCNARMVGTLRDGWYELQCGRCAWYSNLPATRAHE